LFVHSLSVVIGLGKLQGDGLPADETHRGITVHTARALGAEGESGTVQIVFPEKIFCLSASVHRRGEEGLMSFEHCRALCEVPRLLPVNRCVRCRWNSYWAVGGAYDGGAANAVTSVRQ